MQVYLFCVRYILVLNHPAERERQREREKEREIAYGCCFNSCFNMNALVVLVLNVRQHNVTDCYVMCKLLSFLDKRVLACLHFFGTYSMEYSMESDNTKTPSAN